MIGVPLEGGALAIRGAIRIERTERGIIPRRLSQESWDRIPDAFMRAAVGQSAGIRLAFRTAATRIELSVAATKLTDSRTADLPAAAYELCSVGEVVSVATSSVGTRFLFSFEEPIEGIVEGPDDTLVFDGLPGDERDYELWLPFTDEVELLSFSADAPVTEPRDREGAQPLRWLHHGSSISHGYISTTTTRTFPVRVANATGVDLTSLAFSGNALLDQLTARTIRDTPADLISVKLGINVVNGDFMRLRIFRSAVHGFLDTIRDGHPTTPLLVVSPIHCAPLERAPGPSAVVPGSDPVWIDTLGKPEELATGKLSLEIIRAELASIVELRSTADAALGYLDGSLLYGAADAVRLPLPDNLHPGDDVNALIADRFVAAAFGSEGWFTRMRTS
jgi:hypothetical protein